MQESFDIQLTCLSTLFYLYNVIDDCCKLNPKRLFTHLTELRIHRKKAAPFFYYENLIFLCVISIDKCFPGIFIEIQIIFIICTPPNTI